MLLNTCRCYKDNFIIFFHRVTIHNFHQNNLCFWLLHMNRCKAIIYHVVSHLTKYLYFVKYISVYFFIE